MAPSLLQAAVSPHISEAVEALPVSLARRVRLIPARTALGERLMLAIAPEHVYLREEQEDEAHEVKALIAPTGLTDRADGIAALVPSELMMT
jgi:hypothetical protein